MADDAPDAYEKVVDQLLDSDAYAERMGHGMDGCSSLCGFARNACGWLADDVALAGLGDTVF